MERETKFEKLFFFWFINTLCDLPFSINSPHFFDHARKFFAYPFSISARSWMSVCRSVQSLRCNRKKNILHYHHRYRFNWIYEIQNITYSHPLFVLLFFCSFLAPKRNPNPLVKGDHRCDVTFLLINFCCRFFYLFLKGTDTT